MTGGSLLQSRLSFHAFSLFLQGYIPVFLWRIMVLLVLEHFQITNKCRSSILWIDHRIDIPGLRRLERVGKLLPVLLDHLVAGFERICGFFERVAKHDTDGALRTHDRDLSRRIGQVNIATEMLARHHDITATVSLSGDNRHFRHGGFRVGVEQLCPVADDAVILLGCTRQKARHIDEGYDRYVEAVTKANESRGFDG